MEDTKDKQIKYMYTIHYADESNGNVEVSLGDEGDFEEVTEEDVLEEEKHIKNVHTFVPIKVKKNGKQGKKGRTIKRKTVSFDKEEDNMNMQLIKSVFQRQPLWNNTLPYEKRSYKITSLLWAEVDTLLNLQNGESQIKFKSLRDRYVRLVGERKQYKENENENDMPPPQWKYYDLLKFLQPTITYRTTNSNLKRKERSSSPNNDDIDVNELSYSKTQKTLTDEISNAASQSTSQNKRFRPSESIAMTNAMTPFELYCMKQLEALDKPNDPISAFCAYLESELRCLNEEVTEKLKENIIHLLLQAKKKFK